MCKPRLPLNYQNFDMHPSPHAALLLRGNLHYRRSWHGNSSLIDPKISQPLIYQRVRRCANLFWSDLVVEARRNGHFFWFVIQS